MGLAHTQKVKLSPNIQMIWASPRNRASQQYNRDTKAQSNCEKLHPVVHFNFS